MKDVLVSDVFEALAENGFEHLRENWTKEDIDGAIIGGCVLQQGAMNLGVAAEYDTHSLLNQLNQFLVLGNSKWAPGVDNIPVGDAIIYWNDKTEWDGEYVYVLRAYEDVIEMAREVLTPFMDKTITLAERDWFYKKKESVTT